MKKIIFLFVFTSILTFAQSNNIVGDWQGYLTVSGTKLRLIVKITKQNDSLKAQLDSPDQGARGIPIDHISLDKDTLRFSSEPLKMHYIGLVKKDTIIGMFNQNNVNLFLDFVKLTKPFEAVRPQDPKEPFPYNVRDVSFPSFEQGVTLAGTLTYPFKGGNFPVVILITGSGAQDRNEELMGHKPFLVLADYLSRNGIAVLRFDDRGVGKSTGNFAQANTYDFANDVLGAVEFLRYQPEVNRNKIGLIGHSEGGIIAPIAANKSDAIKYMVLLAGTGIKGDSLLLLQTRALMKSAEVPETEVEKELNLSRSIYHLVTSIDDSVKLFDTLNVVFKNYYESLPEEVKKSTNPQFLQSQISIITSNWFINFLKLNPADELEKVKIPVLALNGDLDLQVPSKQNLAAIESALKKGNNNNYKIMELKGLNHLFQKATTGNPSEYNQIQETMNPEALKIISEWINKVTKD